MNKKLLLTFVGILTVFLSYAQVPAISVPTTEINETLELNDTIVVGIPILNIGNRDLNYEVEFKSIGAEFEKSAYADWNLRQNQDLITPELYITRQDDQGIFNFITESSYAAYFSPENTEWAEGKTKDLTPGDYGNWQSANNSNPPSMVNNYYSLHVIDRDIYYDILWHSWSSNGTGGGFSYTRYEIPSWMWTTDDSGSIIPTQSDTLWVVLDARILNSGLLNTQIVILSNDPNTPEVIVDVSLTVNGDPEVSAPDSVAAFSDVYVGQTATQEVVIWNMGQSSLTITDITNDSAEFVAALPNTTIQAGTYEIMTIDFTPTANIGYMDTIVVSTNDPATPSFKIYLSGNGILLPDIDYTPTSFSKNVDYGADAAYGVPDTALLILTNTGENDLIWSAKTTAVGAVPVTFIKNDYADYHLSENQDAITDNVHITRASSRGIFNIAAESQYSDYSPLGTLWFDGITAESMQGDHELGIRNAFGSLGSLPGNTLSMYIPETDVYYDVEFHTWTSDANGGGFSYTRTEAVNWLNLSHHNSNVLAGEKDTIYVLFNPSDYKTSYDAEIVITTNVPGNETIVIPLSYTVSGPPEIEVNPTSYNYGNVYIGEAEDFDLTMQCWGASGLEVSSIATTGSIFTVSESSLNIGPDSNTVVTVTFTPALEQLYRDTIVIRSNAATDSIVRIPLSGVGLLPPVIGVSPSSITHTLVSGSNVNDTIFITNTGDSNLDWNLVINDPASTPIEFTKKDYADVSLPENQDRVSDNVWLTRDLGDGLYNIAQENSHTSSNVSPMGTLWFDGLTSQSSGNGDYAPGLKNVFGNVGNLPGNTVSMYIPENKSYYDLSFTSWTSNWEGGGFSYLRRKVPTWIKTPTTSGTTLPGESDTVIFTLNTTEIYEGTHAGEIIVESNDPSNSSVAVAIVLNVTGEPEISITDTIIGFNDVLTGYSGSETLTIKNMGTAELNVSNILGTTGFFVAQTTSLVVPAMDSVHVEIVFSPTEAILYEDTLVVTSDDATNATIDVAVSGTGLLIPVISVVPESIEADIFTDSVHTGEIYIENTGAGNLMWSVKEGTLESALINLNQGYDEIVDLIPSMYVFAYDGGVDNINDGGNDMYDTGNRLSTNNSAGSVPYSDNAIVDGSAHFGTNTRYFTRHLPGLFVMAADVNNIDYFAINGNNGADGSGMINGQILEVELFGNLFQGFVKRVYEAGDPSINHLIIVEKQSVADHNFSLDSDDDYHQVTGLNYATRIYYILYAGTNGYYIDDAAATNIMTKFINVINNGHYTPSWITFDATSGTAASGETDTVTYTIDPGSIPENTYSGSILIESNDPVTSEVVIPVSLQYGSILIANSIPDTTVQEGFGSWSYDYSNVFVHPQDLTMTYIIASSETGVVTSVLNGDLIELTEAGVGTSIITLRADDGNGRVAYEDFDFKVNGPLVVSNPLSNLTLDEGFGTYKINISNVFSDPNNDPFTITSSSSNTSVATTSIDGDSLVITEVGIGTSTITLTADDGYGDMIDDDFVLTVNEVTSGISDEIAEEAVKLYPIPSNGTLYLELGDNHKGEVQILVNDAIGRLVYHDKFVYAGGTSTVDLATLKKGLYIIRIKTSESEYNKRIILE